MATQTDPQSPQSAPAACCAFFACKVAFSLPESDYALGHKVISKLMEISPGNVTVEDTGGPCSPPLMIVDVEEIPTLEWVEGTTARINAILHNSSLTQPGLSNT